MHHPEPVISQAAVSESQPSVSRLHQPEPISTPQNSSSGALNTVITELSHVSNIADVGGNSTGNSYS